MEEHAVFMGWKAQYCWFVGFPQTNLLIQPLPNQNFCRNWQADYKIHVEMRSTYNSQDSFENEEQSWRTATI